MLNHACEIKDLYLRQWGTPTIACKVCGTVPPQLVKPLQDIYELGKNHGRRNYRDALKNMLEIR
jgi:hypothetical protein